MAFSRMKALFAVVAPLAVAVSATAAVVYVKPDGTGTGSSWADAANLEAAVTAAAAAGGKTDLYLAKGVYYPAATVRLTGKIALYGGFTGLSADEAPETRDLASAPSIISGDVNGDDNWEKFDGSSGKITKLASVPILLDGAPNVPGDLVKYTTVAPNANYLGDNLIRLLVVAGGAEATLDGIVLQGGGRGDKGDDTVEDGYKRSFGGTLLVAPGGCSTIRACRIFGASAWETPIYFGGTAAAPSTNFVSGLLVDHCRGARMGGMRLAGDSWTTMTNCAFVGNARFCQSGGWQTADAAAALVAGNRTTLNDCLFEGNVTIDKFAGGYVRSAAVLCLPYCGALRSSMEVLRGLVFRDNASYSSASRPFPLVAPGIDNYKLNEFVMCGNLVKADSPKPLRAALIDAEGSNSEFQFTLMNSTVYSNTISIAAGSETNVIFAAPVLACARGQFVNCTFYDNTTSMTAPEGVAVHASRAILGAKLPGSDADKPHNVTCFNCVFAGSTPLPDIVDAGDRNDSSASFVANSIVWATGDAASTPRIAVEAPDESGTGNAIEVGNCIIKSISLLGGGITLVDTVTETAPGLGRLGLLDGADPVPVMQCRARKADLRHSYDVRHWDYYTYDVYPYYPGGSTTGGKTRDGRALNWNAATYIGDALGEARPAGAFTLGAVQDVAGLGFTMTVH